VTAAASEVDQVTSATLEPALVVGRTGLWVGKRPSHAVWLAAAHFLAQGGAGHARRIEAARATQQQMKA